MVLLISIGIWIVLFLTAIVILGRAIKSAQNRSSQHLCLKCGYDLRATRDRCPECGLQPFRQLDRVKLREPWTGNDVTFAPASDEELTAVVHETTESEEARLLVFQLELRHIPARRSDTSIKGQPFLSIHQVSVREDQKALAIEIVRAFQIDSLDIRASVDRLWSKELRSRE